MFEPSQKTDTKQEGFRDILTTDNRAEINDKGLTKEDLVIGLKEKGRENKRIGRFFTLMSWRLREYFVVT